MRSKFILKGPVEAHIKGFDIDGKPVTIKIENVFNVDFEIDHKVGLGGATYAAPTADFKIGGTIYKANEKLFEVDTRENASSIVDQIDRVLQHDPATIIYWKDGTKTVVKADGEPFDEEKGLAMAIAKKALGNQGNYYETFKKYTKKDV